MKNTVGITVKPFADLDKQILKIESRGCIIDDYIQCRIFLLSNNYYRISAYFLPFKKEDDHYTENLKFSRIIRIYDFDRDLRKLLFEVISDLEVYVRASIVYCFSEKYGPLGYMNPDYFNKNHDKRRFEQKYNSEINNNKKLLFVQHHLENKAGLFPLWVLCELFSFGDIVKFYSDMRHQDQKDYCNIYFGKIDNKTFESWLKCCNDLRNICAHHARLYYRIFSSVPRNIDCNDKHIRLWEYIIMLEKIITEYDMSISVDFIPSLINLIDLYSDDIELEHIGFPENWKQLLLNKTNT